MEDYTINNAQALLEECVANGKSGKDTMYAWFLAEQLLIERTIDDLNTYEILTSPDK